MKKEFFSAFEKLLKVFLMSIKSTTMYITVHHQQYPSDSPSNYLYKVKPSWEYGNVPENLTDQWLNFF